MDLGRGVDLKKSKMELGRGAPKRRDQSKMVSGDGLKITEHIEYDRNMRAANISLQKKHDNFDHFHAFSISSAQALPSICEVFAGDAHRMDRPKAGD